MSPSASRATTRTAPRSSRTSQPWLAAGLSETAATNYLGAIKDSLDNPNMVLDLRIPQTAAYQQNVLDKAVAAYLVGDADEAETMQAITDGWNAITDKAGSRRAAGGLQRQPHRQPVSPDPWIPADRT